MISSLKARQLAFLTCWAALLVTAPAIAAADGELAVDGTAGAARSSVPRNTLDVASIDRGRILRLPPPRSPSSRSPSRSSARSSAKAGRTISIPTAITGGPIRPRPTACLTSSATVSRTQTTSSSIAVASRNCAMRSPRWRRLQDHGRGSLRSQGRRIAACVLSRSQDADEPAPQVCAGHSRPHPWSRHRHH